MGGIVCVMAFVFGYCTGVSGQTRHGAGHEPEMYMEHTHGGEV